MRRLVKQKYQAVNPLWQIYKIVKFSKVFKQTLLIEVSRFIPCMTVKNYICRKWLNMKVGSYNSFAYKVMLDLFYPALISVGNNTVVGYNTTILIHEVLGNEWRLGKVKIGSHTLIGANTTILPGITIGNHVKIGAGTVISTDVPDNSFAFGNPIQIKLHSGGDN
ncbi:acyltransferase [Staphylococcus saccharolyticus]|uniref:acyltransferase n=1 Tax=Staphylococcus saccharolyticus TaxID=33028 RepID=UPI00102DC046|nr:DapH/DapD/GlmU-related protein [Staphylococcus saccharolyticus]TAA94042.1 acetyltransferase [Staphylococcus saccharolyticus]TAA95008.1 acetyltransferase [Staphylococcus saccharolyticus]